MGQTRMSFFEKLFQGNIKYFAAIAFALISLFALPGSILSNIATLMIVLSIIILLVSTFKKNMYGYTFYPNLIFGVTLVRLSLSISLVTVALTGSHDPINIASILEYFPFRENIAVAMIVILFLTLIATSATAKGDYRVTQVAAIFFSDTMPVKCMKIDADINSGQINQQEALDRRHTIELKANFINSMVSVCNFIKNDALVGIIITITLVLVAAVLYTPVCAISGELLNKYLVLAFITGIVIHIPAIFISLASYLAVTRSLVDTRADGV